MSLGTTLRSCLRRTTPRNSSRRSSTFSVERRVERREGSVLTHLTFLLMAVISEYAWVSLSAPLLMKCEFSQNLQKCMCDCKPSPYAVLLASSTDTVRIFPATADQLTVVSNVARSADNRVREGMAGETAVYSKQYSVLFSGE
uniref:Uncharacterized protein n=1 Tax=Oryza meridionalis TaxID=40149 RepID=A0A0E0F917_9ORYZ